MPAEPVDAGKVFLYNSLKIKIPRGGRGFYAVGFGYLLFL